MKYKKVLSSGNHFLLSYPIAYEYQSLVMGEIFETAYAKYKSLGYEFHGRTQSAHVFVAPFLNHAGEYLYWISTWGNNQKVSDQELRNNINLGRFMINLNILSDESKLRVVIGHELLHLIQNSYEFSSPNVEPEQDWLAEATAVWIEEKFSNSNPYVSANSIGKEMYPFDGLQYDSREYSKHGYGLSVIIKGLVDKYSDSAIIKIFEKIKAGILPDNATDPVDAVISVLTESVGNFWHSVLGSYVLGNYYGSQVNFKFLDDPVSFTETITIGTATDSFFLNYDYHDLSGKLFKVTPGNTNTLTTVPLLFTVDDPVNCGILVCKYKKGNEITKIGEAFPGGNGQVTLSDVKPIFDAGYDLVVMVSNSSHDDSQNYQGNNTVELIIKLEKPEILEFNKVCFNWALETDWSNRTDDIWQTWGFCFSPISLKLTKSGNTYSGTYAGHSSWNPGSAYSGSITFTLRDDKNTVTANGQTNIANSVEFTFKNTRDGTQMWYEYKITMTDVEYNVDIDGNIGFQINGLETCDHISFEHDDVDSFGTHTYIENFKCTDDSRLTIGFKND